MASPSSTASFHTATGGMATEGGSGTETKYRTVRALPYELKDHVRVYFEEKMYIEALELLQSLATPRDGDAVLLPPPSHLAFVATLAVHPRFGEPKAKTAKRTKTSTTTTGDDRRVAAKAMQYLRHVLAVGGPSTFRGVGFDQREDQGRRGHERRENDRREERNDRREEKEEEDELHSVLANRQSVWSRGGNFWRIAGWGLGCSAQGTRLRRRWTTWKLWLETMVAAAEGDETVRQGFCRGVPLRTMVAAVLADGTSALFPAVFAEEEKKEGISSSVENEPSILSPTAKRIADVVGLGGVDEDEDEGGEEEDDRKGKDDEDEEMEDVVLLDVTDSPGFLESLPLRRRLFCLLINSHSSQDTAYDAMAHALRDVDLDVFSAFVGELASSSSTQTSRLLLHVLQLYLPASAPAIDVHATVAPSVLATTVLPFAANSVALSANVRMALVIEGLVQQHLTLIETATPTLQKAMEEGIAARAARARTTGKRKRRAADTEQQQQQEWNMLERSSQRLRILMD